MEEEETEEEEKEKKDEASQEEKDVEEKKEEGRKKRKKKHERKRRVEKIVNSRWRALIFYIFPAHVVCIFPSRDTALWLLPNNAQPQTGTNTAIHHLQKHQQKHYNICNHCMCQIRTPFGGFSSDYPGGF